MCSHFLNLVDCQLYFCGSKKERNQKHRFRPLLLKIGEQLDTLSFHFFLFLCACFIQIKNFIIVEMGRVSVEVLHMHLKCKTRNMIQLTIDLVWLI